MGWCHKLTHIASPSSLRAQAARVLHYELLRAYAVHPAALLPRLHAAFLAWPEALPAQAPGDDALGRVVLAAVHDIVWDVLRAPERPADDTATVLGSLAASTAAATCGADVVAAARELWGIGRRLWCWGASEGVAGAQADVLQWSALQDELQGVLSRLAAAPETERRAGAHTSALRALDVVLACLGPCACGRPVRCGPLGACVCVCVGLPQPSLVSLCWLQLPALHQLLGVADCLRHAVDPLAGVPSCSDCGGGMPLWPGQHFTLHRGV